MKFNLRGGNDDGNDEDNNNEDENNDENNDEQGENNIGTNLMAKMTKHKSMLSFITPVTLFATCAILLLIIYYIYENFYVGSSVSTSYICFSIIGIFAGIGGLIYLKTYSSIFEWAGSIGLTIGTAFFYYQFMF